MLVDMGTRKTKPRRVLSLMLAMAAMVLGWSAHAVAQTKLPIATFPFPTISNIYADMILAKGLDRANGFQVEPISYGTGGALWAGIAKGEIPVHNMSPFQLQKMRADGAPLVMFGTLLQLSALQVVTKNPEVKTFSDLKGRTFAGTVAFAEFGYLQIYARKLGFNLVKDVNIVDATTAMAQAQLQANRVDAIMVWEPSATPLLAKDPDLRVIVTGDEAWKFVTGSPGWELFLVARTDFLKENPGALPRLLKMYQDAADMVDNHAQEADEIVSSGKYASKGIPAGTIANGVKLKRLVMDVQPSWDPAVNAQIWKMLELGLEVGQIPAMPDKGAVVAEAPAR
jgi:NitT/TauT family transport system substrate-binding protein